MPKPDRPVYSIDASMIDSMPQELREAMEVFYSEQEQEQAKRLRQENLDYQSELADVLIGAGKGWQEIVSRFGDEDSERIEGNSERLEFFLRRGEVQQRRAMEFIEAFDAKPTLSMFYRDLYGIEHFMNYRRAVGLPLKSILVNHRDREHPYQLYGDLSEFMEAVSTETSFIYMGSFWVPPNGYLTAKRNAMTTINGFCVDLDRVEDDKGLYFQASWVMRTLLEKLDEFPQLMPNYLMLSGTGIQLWYVFGEAIPLLSAKARKMPDGTARKASPRRDKFQRVLRALYEFFDRELPKNRFRVDTPCATISHPFRAPASPSKHHYPTRLFVLGGWDRRMADPLALSEFLGCDLKPYDVEDWDQEEYERIMDERDRNRLTRSSSATERQLSWLGKLVAMGCVDAALDGLTVADADALIKRGEVVYTRRQQRKAGGGVIETTSGHRVPARPRDPGLYRYTLRRLAVETPAGSRYNALFGLAGLGWNCGIPKAQVERDMTALLGTEWAERLGHDGKPLEKSDVKAAMRGWNKLGALRPRDQLESRLQWKYGPPAKRNGRKQKDHLWGDWEKNGSPVVNTAKENRRLASHRSRDAAAATRKRSSLEKLSGYLADCPSASKRECSRDLGMSLSTVTKYWQAACEAAGVEDTRTGNHDPRKGA